MADKIELAPGSPVMVLKLKKEGRVLGTTAKGLIRVAVGSMTLELKPKELKPLEVTKWKEFKGRLHKPKSPLQEEASRNFKPELDLHGLRVEESLGLVEKKLNEALLSDNSRVCILHGIGTGRLLQGIHEYLKKHPSVVRYHLDEKNPGMTWVYL